MTVEKTIDLAGFAKTTHLKFVDGQLRQRWDHTEGHHVWLPVESESSDKASQEQAGQDG